MEKENIAIKNNEFDYSNIIPTIEGIIYLVQYCDSVYKKFLSLIEEDEKKNEQYKEEYKNYSYKKCYGNRFEVYIRTKNYNNITCKDYESFKTAIDDGNLVCVNGLDIKMDLDFKRGKGNDLVEYDNSFSIIFKPYDITFVRSSNHDEFDMNQIEDNINNILKKFNSVNTIFCTK